MSENHAKMRATKVWIVGRPYKHDYKNYVMMRFSVFFVCLVMLPRLGWAWTEPYCQDNLDSSIICHTMNRVSFQSARRTQEIVIGMGSTANGMTGSILLIGDSSWGMQRRDGLEVTLRIDASAAVNRTATTQGDYVGIKLTADDLKYLAGGSKIYLTMPAFQAWYSLDGSGAAINGLALAFNKYLKNHDPFSSGGQYNSDPFDSGR